MKRRAQNVLLMLTLWLMPGALPGQALATATGPGSNVVVGGGVSGFQTDYGHNHIAGGFAFTDVNLTWRVGLEGEGRWLRWHADEQVKESSYLGGLRVVVWPHPGRFAPYAKFLAGAGRITLPYGYAHGGFLAYAPGAGVDFDLSERVSLRAIDVEYQHWPQFTFGPLHPYGVSAGLSFRLNGIARFPKGRRARQ